MSDLAETLVETLNKRIKELEGAQISVSEANSKREEGKG